MGVVAEDACCACHLGASLYVLVHRLCACSRAREADSYAHGIVAYRHTRIHEQMRTCAHQIRAMCADQLKQKYDKRDLTPQEAARGTPAISSVDMYLTQLIQAKVISDFFPLHQMESRR